MQLLSQQPCKTSCEKLYRVTVLSGQYRRVAMHDLTKEKLVESKAAKAIQKKIDNSYLNPI